MEVQSMVDYWLNSAAHDLEVAEVLFSQRKNDWCLFISHLVIEKILKGIYVKDNGAEAPRTHNLLVLANRTLLNFADEQKELLIKITSFNIDARYPDHKNTFFHLCTDDFTKYYFYKIKELYKWILQSTRP